MTVWTWGWLAWIAAFVVLEGFALANDRDTRTEVDTLSQHIWGWFGIRRKGVYPAGVKFIKLRRLFLLLFVTWAVVHLLTGGWV